MQAAVSCVHIAKRLNAKRVQLHTCRLSVHVNVAESLALRIGKHVRPRALCVLNHPVADQGEIMSKRMCCGRVTVTVTEALVLRPPPLEDRGRITESVRILVPVDRMKQKCFQITTKRVR